MSRTRIILNNIGTGNTGYLIDVQMIIGDDASCGIDEILIKTRFWAVFQILSTKNGHSFQISVRGKI